MYGNLAWKINIGNHKIMKQRQPIARKHKKQNIMWIRPLEREGGARYQQIARQVINAVDDGVLKPGDRLPAQRELANTMGVDLTTVTRAYKELRLAGLLEAHGAGGSYIASYLGNNEQIIDLSMNIPPLLGVDGFSRRMGSSLSYMRDHADDASLMSYHVGAGSRFDREAAARWLVPIFGELDPDQLLISAGAQPAISAIILAYSRPGDSIVAEKLTYPGFLAACRVLQRQVLPVETDDEGMLPDDLERVCKENKPKIIYVVPTISNPTATTMSLARRQAIYDIAVRYDIAIIEDDPYWLLAGDAPLPIAALAQDSRRAPVFYISTVSKCLAPGLRTAYVLLPTLESTEKIQEALRAIMLMPNQSTVSMTSHLIRNGSAKEILQGLRRELSQRQEIASGIIPGIRQAHPHGLHLWLELPEYVDQYRLIQSAQEQGLGVASSEAFCVQEQSANALRISLGGAKDQHGLTIALEKLADILRGVEKKPQRQIIV